MRTVFRLGLVLSVILYLVIAFWSLPRVTDAAGGLAPFDLRPFGYDAAEARAFLAALGEAGRAQYLGPQRLLDLAYPAVLGLTLLAGIWRFGARLPVGVRALLGLLPLVGMAADYAENALVASMLRTPVAEVTDATIAQASLSTMVKSGATGASIGLVVILAIGFAVGRRKRMRRRAARRGA